MPFSGSFSLDYTFRSPLLEIIFTSFQSVPIFYCYFQPFSIFSEPMKGPHEPFLDNPVPESHHNRFSSKFQKPHPNLNFKQDSVETAKDLQA